MTKDKAHETVLKTALLVSASVHAWVVGLGWHFLVEPNQLGAWFVVPSIFTLFLTWLAMTAWMCKFAEKRGWLDKIYGDNDA